jgi:hypothetical protein
MGFNEISALMKMSEQDIMAGGMQVQALAEAAGYENVEDFKKEAIKTKRTNITTRSSTDELIEQYKKAEGTQKAILGGKVLNAMSAEGSLPKGLDRATSESFLKGITGESFQQADTTPVTKILGKKGTDKIGDETEKAKARSQEIALDEFVKVKDELSQAATNAQNMTSAMMEALQGLANSIKQEGAESVEEFGKNLKLLNEEMRKQNQTGIYQQPTGSKGK